MSFRRTNGSARAVAVALSSISALAACGAAEPPSPARTAEPLGPDAVPTSLAHDRDVWQELLVRHASIRREVRRIPDGVSTLTESDDPTVADLIKDHVRSMRSRMQDGRRVRAWDPVFSELFDRHDKVHIVVEFTVHGARVTETTDDPETLLLLRSHAAAVSGFVREGCPAARRSTRYSDD